MMIGIILVKKIEVGIINVSNKRSWLVLFDVFIDFVVFKNWCEVGGGRSSSWDGGEG